MNHSSLKKHILELLGEIAAKKVDNIYSPIVQSLDLLKKIQYYLKKSFLENKYISIVFNLDLIYLKRYTQLVYVRYIYINKTRRRFFVCFAFADLHNLRRFI